MYIENSKKTTLNDDFDKMEVKIKNIKDLYQSLIKCTLQFFKEVWYYQMIDGNTEKFSIILLKLKFK